MIPLEFFGAVERTKIENVQSVVDSERRNRGPLYLAVKVRRNLWQADPVRRNQRAVGDAWLRARRRIDPIAHPCGESGQ